jgi:hypothetical protein
MRSSRAAASGWRPAGPAESGAGKHLPGLDEEGWQQADPQLGDLLCVMAVVNEAVWRNTTTDFWIAFKLWGAIPATLLFAVANVPMLMRTASLPRMPKPPRPGPDRMSEAIIRIEGLKKAYANGVEALKGVDLDIRRVRSWRCSGPMAPARRR